MRAFDVICAGEALVINAALALAQQGLRVGLATVLSDDTHGRATKERIAAKGVDVTGVDLAQPTSGLVFVRGGARQVVPVREEERPVSIPEGWSSKVLLLSGMSPIVSHGAALCKAARAGRRMGSVVVVDVNARWDLWEGRDARSILMVLREADVVWCSAEDLFGMKMSATAVRASMRKNAVLALSDGAGSAFVSGPFGEVARAATPANRMHAGTDGGDAFATAICAELARAGHPGEESGALASGALWQRALDRGHEEATALASRMAAAGRQRR